MEKYIGLDVHAPTTTMAIMSSTGRRLKELVVETKGEALVSAVLAASGSRHLCMEEGTQSQWLYELLEKHVDEIVVVSPMKRAGNKSDSIDAWALAEQLRVGAARNSRVFKARRFPMLRAASRAQRVAARDMVRSKNRLRAVYRSRGLDPESEIYSPKKRETWQKKLPPAERKLAEQLAQHLDAMTEAYDRTTEWLAVESAKISDVARLCTVPGLGPVSAAHVVATVITPERFRTKRQFWSYCGLAIVTRSSSDWVQVAKNKQWERRAVTQTRGLNRNRHPMLKSIFKRAAIAVLKMKAHPLRDAYEKTLRDGTKPNLACLTLARRIAAAALAVWKTKEVYDPAKHCPKTT